MERRIDRFAIAAWSGRTRGLGGAIVHNDGLVTFLTGLPPPPLNPTLVASDPDDPEAALVAAEAACRSAGVAFGIEVDPARRPRVRAAAARAGLSLLESRPVMSVAVASILSIEPPDGVSIARGEPFLDEVARVDTAAFGGDLGVNRAFLGGAEGDDGARIYVAFLDGVAVGCGETYLADGVVGVFGVATVPEARRSGIATALTSLAVRDRIDDADVAVLVSSELGHGAYERLGLRDVGVGEIWTRVEA